MKRTEDFSGILKPLAGGGGAGVLRKFLGLTVLFILAAGCTVKAVGDPNRPITINANVVVDIRGLKQTATGIEDMVAQGGGK